jgi:hypothetical protein
VPFFLESGKDRPHAAWDTLILLPRVWPAVGELLRQSGAAMQASRRAAAAECRGLMEVRAFEHGKELMDTIRSRHAIVASNVERFVVEIGTKFIARPEERLLNVVHSLLQRCYRLPLPQGAHVPEYMKKELKTVCDACLSQEMQVSWRRRGMLADVRESFVGDVRPQRTTTLKQLMTSLKVRPHTVYLLLHVHVVAPPSAWLPASGICCRRRPCTRAMAVPIAEVDNEARRDLRGQVPGCDTP